MSEQGSPRRPTAVQISKRTGELWEMSRSALPKLLRLYERLTGDRAPEGDGVDPRPIINAILLAEFPSSPPRPAEGHGS